MILELELGAVIALQLAARLRKPAATPAAAPTAPAPVSPSGAAAESDGLVEVLKKHGEAWLRIGSRHAAHPDIHEALHTPGLAVRHIDGSIEEGKQ